MAKQDYDAIVVGSGPNGLSAAITMQRAGFSVMLIEGDNEIGGGLRTAELTLPGFHHDICSAIHPLAAASPFFNTLPLEEYGLEFIYPDIPAAHPLDNAPAAVVFPSLEKTTDQFPSDRKSYLNWVGNTVKDWPSIAPDILGPLHFPHNPMALARFGTTALLPALTTAKKFSTSAAKALWAGMAAHAIQPLSNLATSAAGMVLLAQAHLKGWPLPKGGAMMLAKAMASYFKSIGGIIQTGTFINRIQQLPSSKVVLLDITPAQLLRLEDIRLSSFYKWQMSHFRYGMGVFKIDWALNGPIPFSDPHCRRAGTIHLGGTINEIAASEKDASLGRHSKTPFVLLAQQSVFDTTRAPANKQTAWGYCHVPNGSTVDMTAAIENQVERFAPGFKDLILARHTFNTSQLQHYNPNYIGGDINGGQFSITQLFTRPVLRLSPYRTSEKGIYLCSSSTPPGGGVHGMCGYHAAKTALKDIFKFKISSLS